MRGYQFQGQRQPAASTAQGDQMRRDGVIDRQGRARFANAVGQQPHLAIAVQLHARFRRGERGKRQHGLAVDRQRYPAGGHQREHGRAAEQGGGQRGGSVYDGLAPVQYQQDTAERSEVVADRDGRIARPDCDAERQRDARGDDGVIGDRCHRDPQPTAVELGPAGRHVGRQAGFAHPAETGDGNQARLGDGRRQLAALLFPSDEGGRRHRDGGDGGPGLTAQRRQVDLDGLGTGIDAQLIAEDRSALLVGHDGARPVSGAVQRGDEGPVQALLEWVDCQRAPCRLDRPVMIGQLSARLHHEQDRAQGGRVDPVTVGTDPVGILAREQLVAGQPGDLLGDLHDRPVAFFGQQLSRAGDILRGSHNIDLHAVSQLVSRRDGRDQLLLAAAGRRAHGPQPAHHAPQRRRPGGR